MLNHPAQLFALVAIVLAALIIVTRRAGRGLPYEKRRSLLTPTELHFKKFLDLAAPANTVVMAQVGLEEIIVVKSTTLGKKRSQARSRIKSRRMDFVLCHRSTMNIECAIELNGRSHERNDRKARDAFVRSALAAADVPFLEIPAARHYDLDALRSQIAQAIRAVSATTERSPAKPLLPTTR